MKVPENHGKRKHGNNTKNKRQHRADEQFEIRQSNVTIGFRPKTGKLNLRGRNNNNWGK